MNVRTPTILQIEAVECGAAALGMILAYHGRHIPLEDLRVDCGVSRDGSKATNILAAARNHGLVASGKRLELPRLREIALPVIVFVNMNHFVVLEAITRRGYRLNDPAMGRRTVDAAEFDGMFTGVTLIFKPGPDFRPTPRPPGALRSLAGFLRQEPSAAWLIVVAGLGLIVPGLAVPGFTRVFVDDYLMGKQTDWLFGIGALMLAVILLQTGLMWLRAIHCARLETKLALAINAGLTWRLLRLPVLFFSQRSASALSARGQMASAVARLSSQTLLSVILESATVVFFMLVMASYSLVMTAIVAALLLAGGGVVFAMQERLKQASVQSSTEMMTLVGKTMVGIQSIESIKSSGTEARFFESWAGTHAKLVNAQAALALPQAFITATPALVCLLGKSVSLVAGGVLVMDGKLTIGSLVAFQALLAAVDAPFCRLIGEIQQILQSPGPVSQVRDVTSYPVAPEFSRAPAAAGAATGGAEAPTRLSGRLRIRDLSFGYNPLSPPLIQGFSADIPPGHRIALVGGSGSGKSTIGRVLTGLYPALSGRIEFDGLPIEAIDRDVLRGSIAVVDQNIVLFEASFLDNIRLWDTTIDEATVVQAARDAEIHDFIAGSHDGYHTIVEECGRNMSGGQRQRVEIARALARKSAIIVLDEATSALDPIVEARVMENITRRGATCIIIAHRLSTIRDCDEILVLDRGSVVQRGTHEAMREVDGPYKQLLAA
jgi:NHLM bacteriocin system ABC transporter peptidase/ATP-binding protein